MTQAKSIEPSLAVDIAGVRFKNPIMPASGTFASGKEFMEYYDISRLGAIVTKGVSLNPWAGNATPRVAETYGGMLNAIGLQNPGVEGFITNDLPFLQSLDTNVIVNVCGHNVSEYCAVASRLSQCEGIDMLELNISCPNISEGGMAFGTDWKMTEKVVKAVKQATHLPLIVKLSPNVTDIRIIAKAAESAGADALSLINTLLGMRFDLETKQPILANKMGGLSGPAIKPVAVRMVYQVRECTKLPIIGMGGIMTADDVIEFMLAGADAVAVGTANFHNPMACIEILEAFKEHKSNK